MELESVAQGALALAAALLPTWIALGSLDSRRRRQIRGDMELLRDLPSNHSLKGQLEERIDRRLALYLRRPDLAMTAAQIFGLGLSSVTLLALSGIAYVTLRHAGEGGSPAGWIFAGLAGGGATGVLLTATELRNRLIRSRT